MDNNQKILNVIDLIMERYFEVCEKPELEKEVDENIKLEFSYYGEKVEVPLNCDLLDLIRTYTIEEMRR